MAPAAIVQIQAVNAEETVKSRSICGIPRLPVRPSLCVNAESAFGADADVRRIVASEGGLDTVNRDVAQSTVAKYRSMGR